MSNAKCECSQLNCCGVTSYKDFNEILHRSVPGSCCGKPVAETCDPASAMEKQGCAKALEVLFKSACGILGGIALGIAAIEVSKRERAIRLEINLKRDQMIVI